MTDQRAQQEPAVADPVVQRYTRRMRPWRIAYAIGLVIAVAVLLVIVKIAYSVGEISHATLHTVPSAPPSIVLGSPDAAQSPAWRTGDRTAIGTPYAGGTVVTFDAHTVRGRDARTGKVTWSYTRTDRTVCTAAQLEGVTVAVYELNGNCDELTGLDTGTGDRNWTRTLDKDSNVVDHAVDGHPHYIVSSYTFVVWTPQVIYAIDPSGRQDVGGKSGGLDRWVFAERGCTIHDVVLGTAGALISQTCSGRDCSDLKFCGNGPQLLLRDGVTGEDTDSSKNGGNPDQIDWNLLGSNLVPAAADTVIAAISPDGTTLVELSAVKGHADLRLALAGGTGRSSEVALADGVLIRFAGTTYAVRDGDADVVWSAETAALPTVTGHDATDVPDLARARLTVPGAGSAAGIAELDPSDGTVAHTFAGASPVSGSAVYPYGSGFLVAGTETVLYR